MKTLTIERNAFEEKYVSQKNEIENLRENVIQSRNEITLLINNNKQQVLEKDISINQLMSENGNIKKRIKDLESQIELFNKEDDNIQKSGEEDKNQIVKLKTKVEELTYELK